MLYNNFYIVAISVILSLLPVFVWGMLFLYRHNEKRSTVVRTFMLGALMVIPLVIYRISWNFYPKISLVETLKPLENHSIIINIFNNGSIVLPLSLLLLFLSIGIIEEFLKQRVTRSVDRKEIKTIDDAIEFSIIAALGFSFAENVFYFIDVWQSLGVDTLAKVFVFRSLFSTFAHILFSAIFGYHFGLALFAKSLYREQGHKARHKKAIGFIHRILRPKNSESFEDRQLFIGFFYAAILHAMFNILLELNYTQFLIPFLVFGLIHVLILIWNRENHVEYSK